MAGFDSSLDDFLNGFGVGDVVVCRVAFVAAGAARGFSGEEKR